MILSYEACDACINGKSAEGCPYKNAYDSGTTKLREFILENRDIEWYGRIKAECAYSVHDPESSIFHMEG